MGVPVTAPTEGLTLTGIGVRFGGLVALDDVSLDVGPGRIVGVIGPNGAGKTTLFNVVCGFVRPTAGTMTWDGVAATAPPAPAGHARHRPYPAGGRPVRRPDRAGERDGRRDPRSPHRVRLGACSALPRSDRDERRLRAAAMAHLERFGIAEYARGAARTAAVRGAEAGGAGPGADRRAGAAAARRAGRRPGADEIDELATLIRGLPAHADRPCSVMLVEHHMDLVMRVCDEIVVLDFGKVIAHGDPATIRASAAVTEAYLGTEAPPEPAALSGPAAPPEPAAPPDGGLR